MKICLIDPRGLDYTPLTPDDQPVDTETAALVYLSLTLAGRNNKVVLVNHALKPEGSKELRQIHFDSLTADFFQTESFDIVLLLNQISVAPLLKSILPPDTPLLAWVYYIPEDPQSKIFKEQAFTSQIDGFVFVSRWQSQVMSKAFQLPIDKCFLMRQSLPPSFDQLFRNSEDLSRYKAAPPTLAFVGQSNQELDFFLKLIPRLESQAADLQYLIFTDQDLLSENQKIQISQSISLRQFPILPAIYLSQILQRVQFFIYSPSYLSPATPFVFEALAAGCDLIAAPHPILIESCIDESPVMEMDPPEDLESIFEAETLSRMALWKDDLEGFAKARYAQVHFMNHRFSWYPKGWEWESFFYQILNGSDLTLSESFAQERR